MSALNHEFSLKEKILFLILVLLLLVFGYYYFVDQPVRTAIQTANDDSELLELEISAAQTKLMKLQKMQKELDTMDLSVDYMPSYNGIKGEMSMLNDVMTSAIDYTITFSNVTRDGNQIRRNYTLQFTSDSYDSAVNMLNSIANSKYRCTLSYVSFSCTYIRSGYYLNGLYVTFDSDYERGNDLTDGLVQVSLTATFYETMVGGKEDSGLPKDTSSSTEEVSED